VLIIGILVAGLVVGALAQMILGRSGSSLDWSMALAAGIGGSFVGGLLLSVIFGDGLSFRPSGIIGSILGAVVVTFLWMRFDPNKRAEANAARRR
jgi:uncharacterized membrane protein YeaQ/YmgE (transglycosylase-associated protein family)